jgi:hypothetical protein
VNLPIGEEMHIIYGLIDPQNMRVFHVGCTPDQKPQFDGLPPVVAHHIAEMAPSAPCIVIFREVDAHPQVEWVKWSKRFRRDILTNDWATCEAIAESFTNPKKARRLLGEEIASTAELHPKFHAFDRKNPEVFEEMLSRARAFRDDGHKTCGVDLLACEIRYGSGDTTRAEGFKIPNNFQAFYARKLQMDDPSLCGLFATNPSVADELVLDDGRSWKDFAREHSEAIRCSEPDGTEEDEQWSY